jgi:hypothetical protein
VQLSDREDLEGRSILPRKVEHHLLDPDTEGFDTADLQEAKALLEEIS